MNITIIKILEDAVDRIKANSDSHGARETVEFLREHIARHSKILDPEAPPTPRPESTIGRRHDNINGTELEGDQGPTYGEPPNLAPVSREEIERRADDNLPPGSNPLPGSTQGNLPVRPVEYADHEAREVESEPLKAEHDRQLGTDRQFDNDVKPNRTEARREGEQDRDSVAGTERPLLNPDVGAKDKLPTSQDIGNATTPEKQALAHGSADPAGKVGVVKSEDEVAAARDKRAGKAAETAAITTTNTLETQRAKQDPLAPRKNPLGG